MSPYFFCRNVFKSCLLQRLQRASVSGKGLSHGDFYNSTEIINLQFLHIYFTTSTHIVYNSYTYFTTSTHIFYNFYTYSLQFLHIFYNFYTYILQFLHIFYNFYTYILQLLHIYFTIPTHILQLLHIYFTTFTHIFYNSYTYILQLLHIYFTGGIAIPGAIFGVLLGGFLLKRFQMGPKGLSLL